MKHRLSEAAKERLIAERIQRIDHICLSNPIFQDGRVLAREDIIEHFAWLHPAITYTHKHEMYLTMAFSFVISTINRVMAFKGMYIKSRKYATEFHVHIQSEEVAAIHDVQRRVIASRTATAEDLERGLRHPIASNSAYSQSQVRSILPRIQGKLNFRLRG